MAKEPNIKSARDWLHRYGEEDSSWLGDFLEIIRTNSFGLLDHFAYSMNQYLDHVVSMTEAAESPIETRFLAALLAIAPAHGLPIVHEPHDLFAAEDLKTLTMGLTIFPQHNLKLSKNYRADFLLMTRDRNTGAPRKLIVECDGHDFHEKTKEQAARDKSRDRDMTAAGFSIMRFTGSEIHKDANACAEQACAYLARLR